MKKLLLLFTAVCFAQIAMAGNGSEGNANNGANSSAPPATGAEIDEIAGAFIAIDPYGTDLMVHNNNGRSAGASFVRDNRARGATVCKNTLDCPGLN